MRARITRNTEKTCMALLSQRLDLNFVLSEVKRSLNHPLKKLVLKNIFLPVSLSWKHGSVKIFLHWSRLGMFNSLCFQKTRSLIAFINMPEFLCLAFLVIHFAVHLSYILLHKYRQVSFAAKWGRIFVTVFWPGQITILPWLTLRFSPPLDYPPPPPFCTNIEQLTPSLN